MSGVGIPTATTAITVAAAGSTSSTAARLVVGAAAMPTAGTTAWVSALSVLQASKYELWLCSNSVAKAVSRSGTGT